MGRVKVVAGSVGMVLVVGLWASSASAHVTPEPSTASKGAGDQVFTFRVPNEEDAASTVSLKLQLPQDYPIAAVDALDVNGWKSTVETQRLATPIETDDGTVTDVASTITWTGGKIAPGHYGEFKILAMGLPDDTDSLTFKAIQVYDDGTTVSWIETEADAEHPAAVVELTDATSDAAMAMASTTIAEAPTTTAATAAATSTTELAAATSSSGSSGSSKGLAVAALIVSVLALLAGAGAMVTSRKGRVATV